MENTSMMSEVPGWLASSPIYKRFSIHLRQKLDAALLNRPSDAMLESIAAQFKLSTYGITVATLKKYARKLEQWVRPSLAAQVLGGVLGCLPKSYRRHLLAGGEVLLLSRVMQALTADGQHALPVGDLAKLASVLTSFARSNVKKEGKKTDKDATRQGSEPAMDHDHFVRRVRDIYNLEWPPKSNG